MDADKWDKAVPWLLALGVESILLYVVWLGDLRTQIHAFWLALLGLGALWSAVFWTLRQKSGSVRTLFFLGCSSASLCGTVP